MGQYISDVLEMLVEHIKMILLNKKINKHQSSIDYNFVNKSASAKNVYFYENLSTKNSICNRMIKMCAVLFYV